MSEETVSQAAPVTFPEDSFNQELPPSAPSAEPQSPPQQPEVDSGIDERAEALAFERFRQLQQSQQPPSWAQQSSPPAQQQPWNNPQWQQQAWQQPQMPPPGWNQQPQMPPQMPPQFPGQGWQQQPPQQLQPFKIDLDDTYDEGLVQQLNRMHEHYNAQFQHLQQSLQSAMNSVQSFEQQQHADFSRWFDRKITELGDDEGSVYGKGPIERLAESAPELQARIQAYQTYLDYLQFQGLPTNTKDDELLARAVRMTRGPSIQQKQLSDQLKSRSKGTIGRPSQSKRTASEVAARDPFTGLSVDTVNNVQSMIDGMLGS